MEYYCTKLQIQTKSKSKTVFFSIQLPAIGAKYTQCYCFRQFKTPKIKQKFSELVFVMFSKCAQVESLRAQVAQKDMFISELLDRIAIVECEVRTGGFESCCGDVICMATDDLVTCRIS